MHFMTVLTLIFVVLKLTNYIDWSWWYVAMPSIIHGSLLLILFSYQSYIEVKRENIRRGRF